MHDDLGTEDMPIRHLVDVQMMAIVDGKERSQAHSATSCATPVSTREQQVLLKALVNDPPAACHKAAMLAATAAARVVCMLHDRDHCQ